MGFTKTREILSKSKDKFPRGNVLEFKNKSLEELKKLKHSDIVHRKKKSTLEVLNHYWNKATTKEKKEFLRTINEGENSQMRKKYGDIKSLADSIAKRELQNPISVIRVEGQEYYVIVSGHRRVRAFRDLHRKSIPAIIRRQSKTADLAIDIAVENLQREDLTPSEKAETLSQLIYTIPNVKKNPSRAMTLISQVKLYSERGEIGSHFLGKYGFTEGDLNMAINLMKLVGMSSNTAVQYLRIFDLPEDMQDVIVNGDDGHTCAIPEGKISVKAAYELTRIKDPEIQRELFEKAINDRLKYIQLKFVVDEVIENDKSVSNRNLGKGTAGRRSDDDAGAAELTEDLFMLSSTVWNFRRKMPLICRRLDKVLWVAALNKMKHACKEMILNINNLLGDDMTHEGWLEYANLDLEISLRPPGKPGEKLRFSFPRDIGELLELDAGDKLLVRIEGVVRHGEEAQVQEQEEMVNNAEINPGSSYLWVGQDHHLNREEVAELIARMQHWLKTGRLEAPK